MKEDKTSQTDIMANMLNQEISITDFMDENSDSFLNLKLHQYLEELINEKGWTKAKIIRDSGINRRFFFDILSGKRNPSRDYVIRILIALQTPLKNVQWLLKANGYAQLYARDKRDSVIIYTINHQHSVDECNRMLGKIQLYLL